jgi:nucleoside-diphosphate-sugar epimerase
MRFDIVLNNLAGLAWTTKEIRMISDGSPWRPLVHVLDICDAVACTLDAPRAVVHNEVINVGDSSQNYRVREIAQIVSDTFPGCRLTMESSNGDNRSYRVSFDKIKRLFPKFKCRRDATTGARQFRELFERIQMPADVFEFRAFTRLKQIEHLINTGQLDQGLFWK